LQVSFNYFFWDLSSKKEFSFFFFFFVVSQVSGGLFVSSLLTFLAYNLLEFSFVLFWRRTKRFVQLRFSMRLVLDFCFFSSAAVALLVRLHPLHFKVSFLIAFIVVRHLCVYNLCRD